MQSINPNPTVTLTQKHQTPNPYEAKFGYSRAIRKGPLIFVSGTTSILPATGKVACPDSAYEQTRVIFEEIFRAVKALGGRGSDVVRVRMFVTRDQDTGDVGRGMKEAFAGLLLEGDGVLTQAGVGGVKEVAEPAATMIVGARFVDPDMKVEIEADAVVL
ncbi:YjgF-like protein [Coprinopsis marcescibilis]|uniref:YjgF-like protein n=1 Tax=Coprinopsis marcescibilis TaxID=230819 RepID=A0A5C3L2T9_COPMA|nr:YjgF-like protein [Coprinopsis marcescibilis]